MDVLTKACFNAFAACVVLEGRAVCLSVYLYLSLISLCICRILRPVCINFKVELYSHVPVMRNVLDQLKVFVIKYFDTCPNYFCLHLVQPKSFREY